MKQRPLGGLRIQPGFLALTLTGILLIPAAAEVVKVEITGREVVSGLPELIHTGPYEIIKGIIFLEVNPDDPANRRIIDLQLAPKNGRGRVEFSTDFELHKPVDAQRGNRRLVYFVNNRGHRLGHLHFNHQAGKNWLYSRGYSYLWCGWNCDVIESDELLNIRVPVISENGGAVTGRIYSEIISFSDEVTYSQPLVWGDSLAYPPVTLANSHATLTKRQYRGDAPVTIPRDGWSFGRLEKDQVLPDPGYLYIKAGFTPGWLYDLVYTGKDPKVTGLGLAAIRDVVAFLRYEKADREGFLNPLAGVIDHAFAWGHSQSARLLNHFVYLNFNGDENKRMVFDGIMANCAGAGKGQFNSRFAQFTRHGSHHEDNLYPVDFFPLATVEQSDPVTGEKADAFGEARQSGLLPKMMFINSSSDYWTRAASLLHSDVQGRKDIAVDPNVRIYAIAGIAHTESRIGIIGRALLTALDEWVSLGAEPPRSQIPMISNGTLVTLEAFKKNFPRLPNVIMPGSFYEPYRLDPGPRWEQEGIADNAPPKAGPKYVCLVPQVDEDGNEMAGIRLPEIEAPLATYTGWSMRDPAFSNSLRRNAGAVWPLPRTPEERQKNTDPRRSILERYPDKRDYLLKVTECLLHLRTRRLLLDEDVRMLLVEAALAAFWSDVSAIRMKEVSVQPAEVKAGETLRLSVSFAGPEEGVLMVWARFREAQDLKYPLNDAGINGDGRAGDNTWSGFIQIPDYAPAGQFHLDIQALDKDLKDIRFAGTTPGSRPGEESVAFQVK